MKFAIFALLFAFGVFQATMGAVLLVYGDTIRAFVNLHFAGQVCMISAFLMLACTGYTALFDKRKE